MLYNTRGIIFHRFKYSESNIIARVYTERFGLRSFIVRNQRKSSFKSINCLYSLALADMVIYHKERSSLHSIKEIKVDSNPVIYNQDIAKQTQSLFLAEVLYKCIKEENANMELFSFLWNSIYQNHFLSESNSSFHLYFLAELTKYLGFYPSGKFSENFPVFDLKEGMFIADTPEHKHYISGNEANLFSTLFETSAQQQIKLLKQAKNLMLDKLLLYYKHHIEDMNTIKSTAVLQEVFSEPVYSVSAR
jgi:DNA repair protein RecO (recombination protein O)